MSDLHPTPWVCAQIGSREHYSIPRALHRSGRLGLLLTDYWSGGRGTRSAGAFGRDAERAAQRFHPDLADVPVEHGGVQRLLFEMTARLLRRPPWATIMARNAWVQRMMVRRLRRHHLARLRERPGVFFAYSYAALDLVRFFRESGWKTVLGQIDPGVREEEIVAEEHARHPDLASNWQRAPAEYWRLWRDECALCNRIVVNSPWSLEALMETGFERDKIDVIPLAFEPKPGPVAPRILPTSFDNQRPLRILFLGQIVLRKGAHLAFEAARRLRDAPVEWIFVGPAELKPPPDLAASPRFRWSGPVARASTQRLYEEADLFLLPTLSDGFALTQLEAQAARLPVLASRFCGAVVRDGENGRLIDPLTVERIVEVVDQCQRDPALVAHWSARSGPGRQFSLEALEESLLRLEAVLAHGPMA